MMNDESSNTTLGSSANNEATLSNTSQIDESNSLTQSLNALKTFNPRNSYQIDTYVDALDSFSTWRIAKILSLTKDDFAKLNFDGWSSKWDETIKLGGSKIAPFKKMTPPYTGGGKSAIRDWVFEDSKDLIAKTIEQLNTMTAQKLKLQDPNFINQYLRGKLYILIDAILSQGPLKAASDLKLVSDLTEAYIDFFIEYLNVLPSLLKEYIDGKALNQPLLYLVNEKIGLVSCIPEIFDTMMKFFGHYARCKIFQNNEFASKSYHSPHATKPKEKYTGPYYNQITNAINHFGANGGFEKLLNLLKWELKVPSESKGKSESADKETVYRFPLHHIRWILNLIYPTAPLLTSAFKDKFASEFKKAFFERIDKLTARDLKDNDNQVQALIRESVPLFEEFFGSKDAYSICEQAELEVTLTLLKCPFLERKIKAINEFKDFFDRADPQVDPKQLGEKKRFRYLTFDKLKSWILQKKILEYVMGDQTHVEILKRSISIMKFLANVGALSQDHLDLLWKGCSSTHEEYVRAVYDAVVELSAEVSVDNVDYLFSKIKEIPMATYNEPIIELITKFSINGMKTAATSSPSSYFAKAMKKAPKYEYYGMKLLWDAIQDDSPLKQEFTQNAFTSLTQIAKNPSFKGEKEKYLTACFENLKKGVSVPQCLLLALHILSTYNSQSGILFNSSLEETATKLNKEYNFIDAVVNDFERYIKEVAVVLKDLQEKGAVPNDKQSYCFVGRYNHVQNIDNRLLFLENLGLQVKKGDFTIDHIKFLWNVLVKKAVTEVERNTFLKWLTKCKVNSVGKTKTYIIYDNLMNRIFKEVLCDSTQMENFKIMTPEIFACFEKYFEIINEKEENLKAERNGLRIYKFESLIGYNVLWNILRNCENEKVLKDVKNLLVNVHIILGTNNPEEKLQIWQSFITRWMECLQASSQAKDGDALTHTISLLNLFIVRFDGRKYLNKDGPVSEMVSCIVVDKKDEKIKKMITMPANGTLFLLRKKISEEFGIALFDFDMYISPNYKVSVEIEEEYAITAIESNNDKDREKNIAINIRPQGGMNQKDKFKTLLINNQNIMDNLFDLLGSKSSKIFNDIWEILAYLPFNKNLRSVFEKLSLESEEDWDKALDVACTRKLLYCLRIVTDLVYSENTPWNKMFIKKKGLGHLFKIYFTIENSELSNLFDCKCSAALVRLINYFLEVHGSELTIPAKQLDRTLDKVLNGLSLVTKNDFITDAEDPHLQEDLQKPAHEFTTASFELLKTCIKLNPAMVSHIYNFPDLGLLIRNGLIESNDRSLRIDFANGLINLVQIMNRNNLPEGLQGGNSFFLSFLVKDLLDYAFSHRDKCKEFFITIEHIFKYCDEKDIEAAKIDFSDLANQLAQKIMSLSPFEAQQSDQDFLLQGLMSLLKIIFTKNPAIKDEVLQKSQPGFLQEILHNCLFEIPSALVEKGTMTGPKCKSTESRRTALQLLQSMITGINDIAVPTVQYLKKLLLNNFWRTPSNYDWSIVSMTAERSKTGYVGLENLGCTCYMNSLLQQLYMISDFRDTILETEDINEGKVEDHENLFHQVQLIFGALKISQRQYYDPRLFCFAFKDFEGNPINVLEQMDVDEFFNTIMDRLENVIKPTASEGIIKRIFGGVLSNELICKGCPHYSEREEPCLAISLQVKNKKNILESLQSFTQGEMLEGDNAYLCERCDKKVPTLKRVCIKKLPNVLILVLKRFEFDYDTMQRFKVNHYCEFPQELDMLPYTQGYLKKKESQKDNQAVNNEEMMNGAQEYPSEYYQYTLRGTVIHMGTADTGHYYSFIKDNTDHWYEFNDNIVRPFDTRDLSQEAFGGEEKLNIENIGNAREVKERSKNAYLLFYERQAYFDENGNKVPTMLIGDQNREVRGKVESMSAKILKEIKEDNFKFHATRYIWDRDYSDFVFKLLEQLNQKKDLAEPSPSTFETLKFCTLFFMTVILRAKERARIPKFLKELKSLFRACNALCSWFVECFTFPDIVKEFLVDCPLVDMKYFVVGLLKIAMKNAYTVSKELSQNEFEQSAVGKLVNTLIYITYEQKEKVKLLDKVFDVMAHFSSLGTKAKVYLIRRKMIGRMIYYIVPDKLPTEYKDPLEEFAPILPGESSDLGRPSGSSGVKGNELVKSVSEMISKKKEKIMMENTTVNYNSIIEMIANLVQGLKLVNEDNAQKTYLPVELEEDEKKLLLHNINVVQLLLMHSTTKRAKKVVSNLIANIVYKREDYSKQVFLILDKELRDKDDTQLKVYLICLEKLMLLQDEFQKQRIDRGMTTLMGVIKDNVKYYRATEICLDYLFKLCSRNSWALRLCSENKAFLKFVETWLRENSNPSNGFATGSLKIFKKKPAKPNEQALLQYQSKFLSKSQERVAKVKKIQKNEPEELAPEYDSDEDFSDHQYQIGEKLDYLTDYNGWVSASVLENLDEMIQISVNDTTRWIHYDSDRTGPHLKVQSHTKNVVEFYK